MGRSGPRVLALRNYFYLIRYSILLSHMVGLGFGVFTIAWPVIDSLDSSMRYRRSDSGWRIEARLGIREVVIRFRGL
jgi:hypothetical protein